MKSVLTAVFLFVGGTLFSQVAVTMDAIVLNATTNQPVEFANVQFLDMNLGTVSDGQGKFRLQFDEEVVGPNGVLQISALGYATKKLTLDELYKILEKQNVLFLIPTSRTLSKPVTAVRSGDLAEADGNVYGMVTSEIGPVQGAVVRVKGTFTETVTNVDGKYRINAEGGDVLQVNHLGMLPTEVAVSSEGELNVALQPNGELLEEVYLETKVQTAYGKKDERAVGYSLSEIKEEDITPNYTTLDQLLVRLTGVQYAGDPTNRTYYFTRTVATSVNGNTLPIFVIDGVIYEQAVNNQLPAIDVQNIANITALPGLSSTVRYGTLGRNGAIIINTKGFDVAEDGVSVKRQRSALVEGNDYSETLAFYDAETIVPGYMAQLQNTNSFDEAKYVYESQSKEGRDIPYYIDVAQYFKKWNSEYASNVITKVAEMAPTNVKALKTVAFQLEELGELDKAKNVYQRIALLRPQEAQSYRDLAHIYKETGEITKAFGLYKRILDNKTEGVDFSGLQAAAENELQHLIAFHKKKVSYSDLPNDLLVANYKRDIRVVMEWNDPNAEFEVQFVDPKRKFFVWNHDTFNNAERMLREVETGYAMEEFIIDDSDKGPWLVNIRYTGQDTSSENPIVLKYTAYKNYGKRNETKTVKTLKLYSHTQKVSVDSFIN